MNAIARLIEIRHAIIANNEASAKVDAQLRILDQTDSKDWARYDELEAQRTVISDDAFALTREHGKLFHNLSDAERAELAAAVKTQ